MKLGKKIQYYRKQKLLSQESLGKLLFVTRQTVSLWEKDQTLPSLDNIVRLADIFGITVDELLSDRRLEESSESVPHVGADADCGTDEAPEIQTAAETGDTARDSFRGSKGKLCGTRSRVLIIAAASVLLIAVALCAVLAFRDAPLTDRRISRAISLELPEYEKKLTFDYSGKQGSVISVTEISFASDVYEQLSSTMSAESPEGLALMLNQSYLHANGSLYCLYNEDLGEHMISPTESVYLLAVYYRESNMLRVTEFEY